MFARIVTLFVKSIVIHAQSSPRAGPFLFYNHGYLNSLQGKVSAVDTISEPSTSTTGWCSPCATLKQ